jgi:hypothetical protein
MEEYLAILNFVVTNGNNTSMFAGKDATKKAHPEDLMVAVQLAAEHVALTLVAIDRETPYLTTKKKK